MLPEGMPEKVFLTAGEVRLMYKYNTSLPTGQTPGKQWLKAVHPWHDDICDEWMQGTYGQPFPKDHEFFGQIPIYWQQVVVVDAPRKWPASVMVPKRPIPARPTYIVTGKPGCEHDFNWLNDICNKCQINYWSYYSGKTVDFREVR